MDAAESRRIRRAEASQGCMTVSEAGKKGGDTVKEKYGVGYYSEIGKKGGRTTKKRHGPEFYSEIGQLGGSASVESKKRKKSQSDDGI